MIPLLQPLMTSWPPATTGPFLVVVAVLTLAYMRTGKPAVKVPRVGVSGVLGSALAPIKALKATKHWVQEGFDKGYAAFTIPSVGPGQSYLVLTSDELVDELRKAPEESLSFLAAMEDIFQSNHMFNYKPGEMPYHITVIQSRLTRQLDSVFPELYEETQYAFEKIFPAQVDGWMKVPAFSAMNELVARISSRIFVGLPLCRNKEYIDLVLRYTSVLIRSASVTRLFPALAKPWVAKYMTPLPRAHQTAIDLLGPVINDRKVARETAGQELPNDLITWFLDFATGVHYTTEALVDRVLRINFASIHTTGMAICFALFHLAAERDKYLGPLRDEVDTILASEGWSKVAMDKMKKLDSFFRESTRMHGVGSLVLHRKSRQPFVFSNGLRVPVGTMITAAALPRQTDEAIYPNGKQFEGFRFVEKVDADDDEMSEHKFVSTSLNYLAFGHGRRACPGRFWASVELKAMMAYLIHNYDIKFEREGHFPEPEWFGPQSVPNRKTEILIRRRQS